MKDHVPVEIQGRQPTPRENPGFEGGDVKTIEFTKDQRIAIIEEALRLLDGGRNWIKGNYKKRRGKGYCYCLEGAIEQAVVNLGHRKRHQTELAGMDTRAVLGAAPGGSRYWYSFNDSVVTSFEDITRVFSSRLSGLKRRKTQ